MSSKEIKELKEKGKLAEALELATAELLADPNNIWPKRNIGWVMYEYVKCSQTVPQFDQFVYWLREIKKLNLPVEENLLVNLLLGQIGKMLFAVLREGDNNLAKTKTLFDIVQNLSFDKSGEAAGFMFKGFHKALKDDNLYLTFIDWWGLDNFRPEFYEKELFKSGEEVMAVAEQVYIAYSRQILLKLAAPTPAEASIEKARQFLPLLSMIAKKYPKFQYPAYFEAKLLIALGDNDDALVTFLPFARKKRNLFWVWDLLGECYSNSENTAFACYCQALLCQSPEEMLVKIRQKMAALLIEKKLFSEAKTEIDLLVKSKESKGFKIPAEVAKWKNEDWYKSAKSLESNKDLYSKYSTEAESIIFGDIPEEVIIIDFVNKDKKIANFIASEEKFGRFKYNRFLKNTEVGDTLKVRFQSGKKDGIYQVLSLRKFADEAFKSKFIKDVSGTVKIQAGKSFGFIDNIYIHQSLVNKLKLTDGMSFNGKAIKTYNKEKNMWSYRLI